MKRIIFIISILFTISCNDNYDKSTSSDDLNLIAKVKSIIGDSTFSTKNIVDGKMAITRVFHQSGNRWYFEDDSSNINLEEKMVAINFEQLLKKDSSLIELINMPFDNVAQRKDIHEKWTIKTVAID